MPSSDLMGPITWLGGVGAGGLVDMDTMTDPLLDTALTTAKLDTYHGVIITAATTSFDQTFGAPTTTTPGKRYWVINNDTSALSFDVVGARTITIDPGEAEQFMWDGDAWIHITAADAEDITFNPAASFVTATNVQSAWDEVFKSYGIYIAATPTADVAMLTLESLGSAGARDAYIIYKNSAQSWSAGMDDSGDSFDIIPSALLSAAPAVSFATDLSSTFGGNVGIKVAPNANRTLNLAYSSNANIGLLNANADDAATIQNIGGAGASVVQINSGAGGVRVDNSFAIGGVPLTNVGLYDIRSTTVTGSSVASMALLRETVTLSGADGTFRGLEVRPLSVDIASVAGTHPLITSSYFAEPNITGNDGTHIATLATTVYILDAPTEGDSNYALYVAAGDSAFLGKIYAYGGIDLGGGLEAEADSGAISLFNMPVTSAPSAGDEMPVSVMIDSEVMFKCYSEADGTGGIQNKRIELGTGVTFGGGGDYGELYISSSSAETTTTGWTDITGSTWTLDEASEFTASDPDLISTNGGVFHVSWSLSSSAGTINDIYEVGISVNGADPTTQHTTRRKYGGVGDIGVSAGTIIVTLTAGQTLNLMHKRISGSGSMTALYGTLTAVAI